MTARLTIEQVGAIVQGAKGESPGGQPLSLPIIDTDGAVIGSIRAFCRKDLDNQELISDLVAWRQRNMRYFFSQFENSYEKTHQWLRDTVLSESTRILFLVEQLDGRIIGTLSASDITETSAELANFIRGVYEGHPTIMFASGLALLYWLFDSLRLDQVIARALSVNHLALRLHEMAGFKSLRSETVQWVQQGNTRIAQVACADDAANASSVILINQISSPEFFMRWAYLKKS